MNVIRRFSIAAMLCLGLGAQAASGESITVASTTSTEQSGLFAHILPLFTRETGVEVRVVAQGTGQALETGRRGDADVVLVHDTQSEERFVREGFAQARYDVMYNDFVLVGPRSDPAGVRGAPDASAALRRIAEARAPFASRGDDSGTHKAELRLWQEAGVAVGRAAGAWYRETGSGMGPTLNTAAGMNAYALADRGSWLSFRNRGELEIVLEGDPRLFNQYGVMVVSKARHPHIKDEAGQRFVEWLVSPAGQRAIASYAIEGEQLFFPNAGLAAGRGDRE
jgi:tungstate transport system substrate-binding protein